MQEQYVFYKRIQEDGTIYESTYSRPLTPLYDDGCSVKASKYIQYLL